jgi:hypothetical protein
MIQLRLPVLSLAFAFVSAGALAATPSPAPRPSASPAAAQSDSDSLLNSSPSSYQNLPSHSGPNYHLVGWLNTFVPGSGQVLLGNPWLGAFQFGAEVSTFTAGYEISARTPLTLDGVPEQVPQFNRLTPRSQSDISGPLYADMLQEFGIKYHFVNTFDSYREAAKMNGITEGIDQTSTGDLFIAPFKADNWSSPWVWIPIASVAAYVTYDYINTTNNGSLNRQAVLSPYSNYLYTVNYVGVQPFGSGAPEEMFFRGFLQHEFYSAVPSEFFSIPLTTALFTFAHAPGNGRFTAAVAGAYLGYLADRNDGKLSQGITVHFWGDLLLGLETVLLNQKAQRSIAPGAFQVQINY